MQALHKSDCAVCLRSLMRSEPVRPQCSQQAAPSLWLRVYRPNVPKTEVFATLLRVQEFNV